MRRKLVSYVTFFMIGIISRMAGSGVVVLFTGTGMLIANRLVRKHQEEKIFVIVMIIMFLLGAFRFQIADNMLHDDVIENHLNKPYTCYGYLVDVKPSRDGTFKLLADVNGTKVLCTYKGEISNCYSIIGRKILFTLRPRSSEGDYYLRSMGAAYSSYINGFLLGDFRNSFTGDLKRKILLEQDHFTDRFKKRTESFAFLKGILFGNTTFMEEEVREVFSSNGTAHILAVSGLHIGILYGFYRRTQKKLRKKIFTLLYLILLFTYGTAAGWSVSVVRAVIMVLVLMAGEATERPYDMLTAALFSSLVILLKNPFYIFTAGFQMSFLAVISIAFLMPVFREYTGVYWSMVIAVQAGLAPYIMYTFEKCSFRGILLNIPTVFLAGILVPVGVVCFFIYMVSGISYRITEYFLMNMSDIIIYINTIFEGSELLETDITFNSVFLLVIYYSVIFFFSSEFFTVHRLRKEYLLLLKVYFVFFLIAYILCICV